MKYCTYLTIYKGNFLPPYYIGVSSIKNIEKGYKGSVSSKEYKSIWLKELTDHSELFKTHITSRHYTYLEAQAKEEFFHRKFDVANNPMYINKCIGKCKFGAAGENHYWYGKTGENHYWYGKKRPDVAIRHKGKIVSEETRGKMSEARKRHSGPNKGKTLSDAHRAALSHAKLGCRNNRYGKHHREDSKIKSSESNKLFWALHIVAFDVDGKGSVFTKEEYYRRKNIDLFHPKTFKKMKLSKTRLTPHLN